MSGKIYIFNGPSASGKSTIVKGLVSKEDMRLEELISVTTREPRSLPKEERDGVDYYFISKEDFLERESPGSNDPIVERTEYPTGSGILYGLFDSEVKRVMAQGKDAITVMDIHGVSAMREFYGPENVISIFVHRNKSDILKALEERKLPQEEIEERMEYANEEMENISKSDYVIYNNGGVEDMLQKAISIIKRAQTKSALTSSARRSRNDKKRN